MKFRFSSHIWLTIFATMLMLQACGASLPAATATAAPSNTPKPPEPTSTTTPLASAALRPTRTPNLKATEHAQTWKTSVAQATEDTQKRIEEWKVDTQKCYELGYLSTEEGEFIKYADFSEEWAQLGWYWRWTYEDEPTNFYMSGHLKWSSAYRSADLSGCGFVFAEQENGDHYAVFLDRSKVLFVQTEYYYQPIGATRGTGRVNFGNPFDQPVEAHLTLIVNDAYAYVLVDGEVVGEYTLSQSKILTGKVGLALLSGTNKDFGTRCEITDLHLWIPND